MAKSLTERNWGTALGEILIVVIGILIGLQVDDWNEARKDRKDEAAFLLSLHEDLLRVDELIGTGRMSIIRDTELRTALVALRQTRAALDMTISEKTASSNFISLPAIFPQCARTNIS